MRRILLVALLLLCFALLISCNDPSKKSAIVFGEGGVITKEVNTKDAGTVTLPTPAGTRARYCIGWYCKDGDDTVFLPVGASYTYEAGESKSFTPLYFHFTTANATTLDTAATGGGIVFSSTIERADWTKLISITENVSCGTLIARASDVSTLDSFTHAALTEAGKAPVADLAAPSWQEESEQALTFGATLAEISDEDIVTPYTAIGYIKITYTNGGDGYVYAQYTKNGAPSRTLASFLEIVKQRLHFTTLSSAALDLTAKGGGITFSTAIDRQDWNTFSRLAKSISCGTLIYPTAGLAELGGLLTHDSLQAAKKTATDIPSSTWTSSTEQSLSFGATLTGLAVYHRSAAYTAVGYAKITYHDDSVVFIYAAYENGIAPEHSIDTLVHTAKNDLSDSMTDLYRYPAGNLFSPYTDAERALLDELASPGVGILINRAPTPGKYVLDPNYQVDFSARLVRDGDEEWYELFRFLGNIDYYMGGALVITATDGTPLTADNIHRVILHNGTTEIPNFTEYKFYNGTLLVPYSVFTPNV